MGYFVRIFKGINLIKTYKTSNIDEIHDIVLKAIVNAYYKTYYLHKQPLSIFITPMKSIEIHIDEGIKILINKYPPYELVE